MLYESYIFIPDVRKDLSLTFGSLESRKETKKVIAQSVLSACVALTLVLFRTQVNPNEHLVGVLEVRVLDWVGTSSVNDLLSSLWRSLNSMKRTQSEVILRTLLERDTRKDMLQCYISLVSRAITAHERWFMWAEVCSKRVLVRIVVIINLIIHGIVFWNSALRWAFSAQGPISVHSSTWLICW